MIVEFGYDQESQIRTLLEAKEGICGFEILYDYGKNPRAFIIYK